MRGKPYRRKLPTFGGAVMFMNKPPKRRIPTPLRRKRRRGGGGKQHHPKKAASAPLGWCCFLLSLFPLAWWCVLLLLLGGRRPLEWCCFPLGGTTLSPFGWWCFPPLPFLSVVVLLSPSSFGGGGAASSPALFGWHCFCPQQTALTDFCFYLQGRKVEECTTTPKGWGIKHHHPRGREVRRKQHHPRGGGRETNTLPKEEWTSVVTFSKVPTRSEIVWFPNPILFIIPSQPNFSCKFGCSMAWTLGFCLADLD